MGRYFLRIVLVPVALLLVGAGPLSCTKPWEMPKEPWREMVAGLHKYLDMQTVEAGKSRSAQLERDTSSMEAFQKASEARRAHLTEIVGATGARVAPTRVEFLAGPDSSVPLIKTDDLKVTVVRWSVYPGFSAEGLLVEPIGPAKANVIAVPDAGVSPEQFAGIAPGLAPEAQIARVLAGEGCRVLVPTLIDRKTDFSGSPLVRFTNLSHREWIYRMSYETGRHIIGYEVDEVRAAVDWFSATDKSLPTGIVGYGEGGLIALYAAAIDQRIKSAWIAGYYGASDQVWSTPIDRNVAGLLLDCGDREVASLLLGRGIDIEFCPGPEVKGPPPAKGGRSDAASGTLSSRPANSERPEDLANFFQQAVSRLFPSNSTAHVHVNNSFNFNNIPARSFLKKLGVEPTNRSLSLPADPRKPTATDERMERLVKGMEAYTQYVVRTSELRRVAYWAKADKTTLDKWVATTEPYRESFWTGLMGKFPAATEPMNVESKQVYETDRYTGYAIKIPVWQGVFASGVLLLPKDLKPGEKRPVVVCQHGLEGTPEPVVDPKVKSVYNSYGAQLADRGYIVYAPQNPYIGNDWFRQLQRKANPLGKSLFGLIVRQHERTLEWLKSRDEVDPKRIAFYGLSYGGKSAMRLPAILKDYCLSICSADFNEWVIKNTNLDRKYSYMYTIEYDMYEFGLAERFNYAEMAALIAPRPFMVERGHDDGVAPDEWIGYEFGKVKLMYDKLGIGDRAELAIFNGGHEIDGKASFAFLAKHLNWPRGTKAP